jgi:hypothetical protein
VARVQSELKAASRRALLAGALGGIGAWAAGAIGRVSNLRAADGDAVQVGGSHLGTATTRITIPSIQLAGLLGGEPVRRSWCVFGS